MIVFGLHALLCLNSGSARKPAYSMLLYLLLVGACSNCWRGLWSGSICERRTVQTKILYTMDEAFV